MELYLEMLYYRQAYNHMKTSDPNKDPPNQKDWYKTFNMHRSIEVFIRVIELFSGSRYCTSIFIFF